ncbi:RNA-directed DNA polymerase from mobile element jockey [Xyrichtys novacula]|uniref:RNA-directed DNA polymerase from mobile element jockey n=1 Tax=Xyrichtys novacula TaxID=13765 RepID=A0AAV1GFX9_XYRNO|nr:RNA-directed DNA polymerase from mobile element jockey [Xyrichtys novacula]
MLDMYRLLWIVFIILWILNDSTAVALVVSSARASAASGGGTLTYSREDLLQLRSSVLCKVGPGDPIPPELRPRKRGKPGGVRTRLRKRRFRPHLPSIILANVRSLKPKMDVLHARCRLTRAFKEACIIALTETWLNETTSDSEVNLDGFTIIRADRTAKYPGAPVLFMGDYNNCRLEGVLPSFQQYVDVPTRNERTLDLCYGNIDDAFTVRAHPPLGGSGVSSDHNIVFLLPHYKPELKRSRPQSHCAPQWSEDAIAQLQGSLACTDWDVFQGDLDERVSVITDYIKFCVSTTIPT